MPKWQKSISYILPTGQYLCFVNLALFYQLASFFYDAYSHSVTTSLVYNVSSIFFFLSSSITCFPVSLLSLSLSLSVLLLSFFLFFLTVFMNLFSFTLVFSHYSCMNFSLHFFFISPSHFISFSFTFSFSPLISLLYLPLSLSLSLSSWNHSFSCFSHISLFSFYHSISLIYYYFIIY